MKYSSKNQTPKKNEGLGKSFLLSACLHAILIILLLTSEAVLPGKPGQEGDTENPGEEQGGQQKDDFGEFKQAPNEVEITFIERPVEKDKDGTEEEKPEQDAGDQCNGGSTYGGVGLSHNWDGTVREAPPQYPAYKAGVRIGDEILNMGQLRGTPGSPVVIEVRRFGVYYQFHTLRGEICYSEKETP